MSCAEREKGKARRAKTATAGFMGFAIIWWLGCGFWRRRWCGRKLPVGPDGAIGEILLLPNGYRALESIDGEAAGVEGRGPVRRADGNEDAGFADLQAAQAMKNGYTMDGELLADGLADLLHFGEGHGFVGFVIEVKSAASVGFVANEAVESDDGAIPVGADIPDDRGHVDGRVKQSEEVVFRECVPHCRASAPTDRGKKRNSIILGERGIPGCKFLIAGRDKGGAESGELRETAGVEVEEIGERGPVCNFHRFFGDGDQFSHPAEEEDVDAKMG